jgi:peptide deformylase
MVYPIVVYGDPVLRKRAEEIPHNGFDVAALAADMFETMYAAHGIGLAAPQIGKSVRMFVVDGRSLEDEPNMQDFKKVFINPTILEEFSTAWEFEEGCLSIPNIREKISRKGMVKIRYFDEQWMLHEDELDGMKARIVQHEYDHLEGKLFLDYLSPFKKRMLKGKLTDISKGDVDTEYRILAPLRK